MKIKLQDINCDRMIENGLKLYLVEHEVATYDVTSCTGNSWETIEARVHALIVYLLFKLHGPLQVSTHNLYMYVTRRRQVILSANEA